MGLGKAQEGDDLARLKATRSLTVFGIDTFCSAMLCCKISEMPHSCPKATLSG